VVLDGYLSKRESMIKRLYVHNFGCLENFELLLGDKRSALLIGKNGTGKSTIGHVLEILQQIGRGKNCIKELLKPSDFTRGNMSIPLRFEIEVCLDNKVYQYTLALELPPGFTELRIFEEKLTVDAQEIYTRKIAQVTLNKAQFIVDWHLIALPIIHQQQSGEPLYIFQSWLASMLILAPIPKMMKGDSSGSTLHPKSDLSNLGEWFTGLLASYPAAYTTIANYLPNVMDDFVQIENAMVASDARNLKLHFEGISIGFNKLSDGEKCFVLCGLVLAANKCYPVFCFWDEPDNYITLSETEQLIVNLRRTFQRSGQLLVTSHNQQIIERFSSENTFMLYRKSHREPAKINLLQDISSITGGEDLISALIRNEIEP
jgi:ABC-type Mn2+/Zn2+ transport system ATPase subunit